MRIENRKVGKLHFEVYEDGKHKETVDSGILFISRDDHTELLGAASDRDMVKATVSLVMSLREKGLLGAVSDVLMTNMLGEMIAKSAKEAIEE